ncbi:Na+/H+ antiporter subunit D [Zhengella mangrovi]|uniref:Na+/H+ antiporter subunit D n=1 Tax=Zhengella mangrovi TaxID=1982044 RepID=A0A2G1QHZ5_9HYPH|nr:Na+/H+ antiporter subunit D [Zhengella mangrovi]PHP65167.1 Na+/H+ antiporter subunit D [Zhengella mangrovi]
MAGAASPHADLASAMVLQPVAAADWLVVAPVVIPIVFGAALLMFRKETQQHMVVSIIAFALLLLADAALLWRVIEHGPIVMTMGRWLPPFGITFQADVLGAGLATVAGLVAFAAVLFSFRDIDTTGRRYGFYTFFLLMMAGVHGAFLTGDIFNLYVWFEVLLISSFGLLVLGSEHEQIDGAVKYAFLNLVATTLFLIAVGLLYGAFGTLNMADLAGKIAAAKGQAPVMTLATLFLFAFAMKAAAFPVNFWLPASYHTPRIIVSALFAGLLTKVGIYALLRVLVMLFPVERDMLAIVIAWVAAFTMVLGILGALAQSDIRRAVGFVVVSGIGVMLAGLALGSELGLTAAILYALHSMIAMTAVYMLVGLMAEAGGSVSLHSLAGLYRAHPFMAALALVLFFAVAGLPPFSGVWPKVFVVKASLDVGAWWLAFAVLLTGLLTTITLGRVFALAFWRNHAEEPATMVPGDPITWKTYAPVVLLTAAVVFIGFYPQPVLDVAHAAARTILFSSGYVNAVLPAGGGA